MKYEVAHYSLRGARPRNEDRVAVAERDNAVLLVLADGLGGHRGGEIASELLVQTMVHAFQTVRAPLIQRPSAFLALCIMQAHQAILRRGKASLSAIQPRTTCVTCIVQNGYAYWAHVGDSRLYHFQHGRLKQRTQDHSTIEEMRKDGLMSEDEMRTHPQKGKLLKCVGGPQKPTIALSEEIALAHDDLLLLCSDGAWESHTPEELLRYVENRPLEEGVEEMLFGSERKMGDRCDNVSAVCFRWGEHAPLSLPLQGNAPVNVDEQSLLEPAANMRASHARREQKREQKNDSKESTHKNVADEIRELERFLRSRDPKS